MVSVLTQTKIRRPVAVVAAFAADPDRAPLWCPSIVSVTWETPKPLAVGSRFAFEARFLARTLRYTYEVAVHSPGHKLVMRTREEPFPMETTYTWHATRGGHTRMTLRNVGEPTGTLRLMGPLLETMIRSTNRRDLKTLRALLEA